MRQIAGLALALLFVSACGTTHRTAARPSPSPTPGVRLLTPLPTEPPSFQASQLATPARASGTRLISQPWPSAPSMAPGNSRLVLVQLSGSSAAVVRDVTDINHPTTLATFDSPSAPYGVFVGAGAVATIVPAGQNTQRIMLIRYSGQPEPLVESYGYALTGLNWSPDGSKLTFMVDPSSSIPWEWHVVSSGIDRIVGYTPGVCACGEGIQDRTGVWFDYSPDGRYMSFVQDAPGGIDLQIRKPDGTLVTDINPGSARSGDYVSQPVWSGGRLYFRDSKGVEVWDSGTVKPFLPGVAWAAPHSSPAGGVITYSAPDATGQPHVFTVETTTGLVRQIAAKVTHDPHFLTDRYIWYRGAQRCPAGYYCAGLSKGPDAGYLDTGVDYIFDLQTGAEYTSRITAVGDIWPRGQ